MTPATVFDVIRTWPIEDQLELANRLWDELAPDDGDADPELDAELDRRIAASEADPTNVVTWEEIAAGFRKRQ
jgi:putative addiction module component (TIGR02574 family)